MKRLYILAARFCQQWDTKTLASIEAYLGYVFEHKNDEL